MPLLNWTCWQNIDRVTADVLNALMACQCVCQCNKEMYFSSLFYMITVRVHLISVHNTCPLRLYDLLLFNLHCLLSCSSRTTERRSPLPRKDKRKRTTKRTKKNREPLKRRKTGTKKRRVPSPEKKRYFSQIYIVLFYYLSLLDPNLSPEMQHEATRKQLQCHGFFPPSCK